MSSFIESDNHLSDCSYSDIRSIALTEDRKPLRSSNIRWLVLVLISLNNIGIYYCLDNPQALEQSITEDFHINNLQFGLLYSVYGLPNIVLPFFGGIITDMLGVRLGVSLYSALLFLGQLMVTLGGVYLNYTVMIVGRGVFGIGAECLTVASLAQLFKWFKDKEGAMSMGVVLCVARLGSSVNSYLSPKLDLWTGKLYIPLAVGTAICLVSWISGLLVNQLDKRLDVEDESDPMSPKQPPEKVTLKDLKSLNRLYYYLLFNCFFIYCAFYGQNANINDIVIKRFGFDAGDAGSLVSIIYLISAIFLPIFGARSDKNGKRAVYLFWASVIFLVSHFGIAFLPDGTLANPNWFIIIPLVGAGAFYSVYAAVFWPCISLVVPERLTGTALGIAVAMLNLGLTVLPLLLGLIHDSTLSMGEGYYWTEITLGICVALGLLFNIFAYFEDMKTGAKLDKPLESLSKRNSILLPDTEPESPASLNCVL